MECDFESSHCKVLRVERGGGGRASPATSWKVVDSPPVELFQRSSSSLSLYLASSHSVLPPLLRSRLSMPSVGFVAFSIFFFFFSFFKRFCCIVYCGPGLANCLRILFESVHFLWCGCC